MITHTDRRIILKVEVAGKTYDYGDRFSSPYRVNRKRTPPEMRKNFVVAEMNDVHHQICRMLAFGMTNKVIAAELGITPMTVSNVKNSPICQKQVAVLRGVEDKQTLNAVDRIKRLADRAVGILEKTLEEESDATLELQNKTAITVLGMNGIAPVKNVQVRSMTMHLQKSDLDDIKQRADELGITAERILESF